MEQKGLNTLSPSLEIENNLVKIVWTFPSNALNDKFKDVTSIKHSANTL